MKSNKIYGNEFSDAECDWIIQESEKVLDINNAVVGEEGDKESSYRKSKTGFIHYNNPDHNELWSVVSNKLWNVVNDANRTNFGFDIGYLDSVQYTVYHDGGDHYDWHIDTFLDTPNAFHRGPKPLKNDRMMLTLDWGIHPVYFKQWGTKMKKSDYDSLDDWKKPVADYLVKE